MKHPCAVLFLCCCLGAAEPPPLSLPQGASDLPSDPAALYRRLDNGLLIAAMRGDEPKNKASIRLFVAAGSLQEESEERGIAHYLEHMAFKGSDNYPPGSLTEALQARGISFGRDFNAHTGMQETVYKLDLPDAEEVTLRLGLQVMAEFTARLSLLSEEVDKERGVIRAEMRDRDTASLRSARALYAALYRGTVIGERFPIGVKETVEAFDSDALRKFYQRWYRLDNMVLSLVGASPAENLLEVASEVLAPLPATSLAAEHREYPPLAAELPALAAVVFSDEELPQESLRVYLLDPRPAPLVTTEIARQRLLEALGSEIISRRLQALAQAPDTPLVSGAVYEYHHFAWQHRLGVVQPKPGQVREALPLLEQSLRRFRQYGPTAAELAVAKQSLLTRYRQNLEQAGSRTNAQLAQALYAAIRDKEPLMSPAQDLAFVEAALPSIEAAMLLEHWQELPAEAPTVISASGPDAASLPGEDELLALWRQSQAVELSPPVEAELPPWAYVVPAPTEAVAVMVHERGHGIQTREYGNHIHAHVLARSAQPGEVRFKLILHLPIAPRPRGWAAWLATAAPQAGLSAHDAVELALILAGHAIRLGSPSLGDDALVIEGSCAPADLQRACELLRASILDPGWREPIWQRARAQLAQQVAATSKELGVQVASHWQALVAPDLDEHRPPTLTDIEHLQLTELRAWLEPHLQTAPIEFSLVGDVEPIAAAAVLDQVWGTMAERLPLPVIEDLSAPGALPPTAAPLLAEHRFRMVGSVDRSVIRYGWDADDAADISYRRRMGMLGQVLDEILRVRIREELGEAYSPYSHYDGSLTYDGYGTLLLNIAVAPDRVEATRQALNAALAELREQGVTQELFEQVQVPLLKSLQSLRDHNRYWLQSVIDRASSRPQALVWVDSMIAEYEAIDRASLSALARKYLATEPVVLVGTSIRAVEPEPEALPQPD